MALNVGFAEAVGEYDGLKLSSIFLDSGWKNIRMFVKYCQEVLLVEDHIKLV